MQRAASIATLAAVSLVTSACGSAFYMGQHPSVAYRPAAEHMSEELRNSIRTVTVIPSYRRPSLSVAGDYGEILPTPGEAAKEGAKEGARAGAQAAGEMMSEDPRALLLIPLIFPVAVIAGTVAGAAGAKIELELQEFRRGLADEIAAEDPERPMPSEQLANEFADHVQSIEDVDVVADGADANIKVAISNIDIVTDDEDAVIRTHAYAVLTSDQDASVLYSRSFEYAERDSLRNWAADDAARWKSYAQNARAYFVSEIAADLFETIHVRNVLRPAKSGNFSGNWSTRVRTPRPTLAWELFLLGGDPYANTIAEDEITFDLRIFDDGQLTYEARGIRGTSHEVAERLTDCRSLAWSVRPVYRIDGRVRAGEWMSYRSGFDRFWHNEALEEVPTKPEFWEYFAGLRTRCAS